MKNRTRLLEMFFFFFACTCKELESPFGHPTQDQRPFNLARIVCNVKEFFLIRHKKSFGTVNPKQANVPFLLLLGPIV